MMVHFCIKFVLVPLERFSGNSLDKLLSGIIIIITRNAAKTIYPRHFVFGDMITSADRDCNLVTVPKSPQDAAGLFVVLKYFYEIKFH